MSKNKFWINEQMIKTKYFRAKEKMPKLCSVVYYQFKIALKFKKRFSLTITNIFWFFQSAAKLLACLNDKGLWHLRGDDKNITVTQGKI